MRSYFILLAIMCVVTVLATSEAGVVVILITTMGIGFLALPLLIMATLSLLCFLPLALSWRGGRLARVGGLLVSLAALFFVVEWPGIRGQQQADAYLAKAPNVPPVALTQGSVRSVEISRTLDPNPNLDGRLYTKDLCGELCQGLLLGDDVEWVRVRVRNDSTRNNKKAETTSVFRVAQQTECADIYPPAASLPNCIVFSDDVGQAADLSIVIEENNWKSSWGEGDFGYVTPDGKRVVRAAMGDRDVLLRTQLYYRIPSRIFLPGDPFQGKSGIERATTPDKAPDIDLKADLVAMGLSLGSPLERTQPVGDQRSWQVPPDAWQGALVASLLNLEIEDGDGVFGRAKKVQINDWLFHARALDRLTKEDRALMCRITLDDRVDWVSWIDQIERKTGPLDCAARS